MNATALRSSKSDISRLMLGWFAMAHPAAHVQYNYLGEAESVEGKAYVIDVKNDDGFAADVADCSASFRICPRASPATRADPFSPWIARRSRCFSTTSRPPV